MADPRWNMWLSMSKAFQDEMLAVIVPDDDGSTTPAVTFPLLNDLHPSTVALFLGIHDADAMDRMYRKWGGRDYRLWNCYVQDRPENVQLIRADLDGLNAAYPTDFGVIGAWHYDDGRPVGVDQEGNGDPWYPQPPQTINFMPDVDTVGTRPTEVSDVLLMFGQPPRTFTPE